MTHRKQANTPADIRDGDRYTMAEAARLKGVSYHTVSRAVRNGKLPAQRLGRMALIAARDLQGWQPMRERAPHKYRRPEPQPGALASQPLLASPADRDRYAERLAVATEQLMEVASAESMAQFGDWLAHWLATCLRQDAAVIWQVDPARDRSATYGAYGIDSSRLPQPVSVTAMEALEQIAQMDSVVALDRKAKRALDVESWAPGARRVIAVPLRAGNRHVGCAVVIANGSDEPLEEGDRSFALRLGMQGGFAIEHIELRRAGRTQFLATRSVFDELPLQLVATDQQGTIVYLNRGFAEAWGEEVRARYLGRHFTHFLRQFRREKLNGVEVPLDEHPLTKALRGEPVEEARYLVPEAFDTPKVFALAGRPTFDERGTQTGAILTAREVTEELADNGDPSASPVVMLANARRRVELLADLSKEIAERGDADEVFDIVASRVCELLDADYSLVLTPGPNHHMVVRAVHNMSSAVVGRIMSRLSVPSAIMAMAERDLIYVNEEEAGSGGREVLKIGGARAALLIPLVDGDQALGVLAVHYTDVDRLRQVDPDLARAIGRQCGHTVHLRNVVVELESSRRRLLTTLDQLPQAVVIMDAPDGHIVAMNRESQALWGPSQERLGQHASEIAMLDEQGDPIPSERHPFLRPLRTQQTEFGVPLITRDATGGLVDVVANVAPVIGRSGEMRGAVAVLHRREHLKPIDQAKDEFISVVAHELRNPLTSLRGNLQLLERRLGRMEGDEAEREVERVTGVIGQVDRIGDLVSRMLDVSRADLGKLTIAPAEADAVAIARSAVADVSGQLDDREIILDAPDTTPVEWDQVRVQQILVNLLANAARYAPEGNIEVSIATDDPDRVSISVRDHGPGVPPTLRRRLFRLYYRFDDGEETADALATKQRGLGIGLYISARLAHAHGGSLTVDDAPGGGARFTLSLPRIAAASDGAA